MSTSPTDRVAYLKGRVLAGTRESKEREAAELANALEERMRAFRSEGLDWTAAIAATIRSSGVKGSLRRNPKTGEKRLSPAASLVLSTVTRFARRENRKEIDYLRREIRIAARGMAREQMGHRVPTRTVGCHRRQRSGLRRRGTGCRARRTSRVGQEGPEPEPPSTGRRPSFASPCQGARP
jgi:hypothetical protein